jgi:hypothetical protein
MSLGNGTTVSGLGTVNDDAHNVDSKGNVQVDFVWGNVPMQPNDDRTIQPILGTANYGTNLDFTKDNHVIVETGWNGYPLYTPNNDGSYTSVGASGTYADAAPYLIFPVILGDATAVAVDNLYDAGFATVTTASAATNTAKTITRVNVTSTTSASVYATGADTAYAVGTQVTIAAGTGIPAAVVGTWYVTASGSGYITIAGTGFTVADTGVISAASTLTGKTGTIASYTLGAGNTSNQTTASTITVTPWA